MPLGMIGKYERLDVLGHGVSGIVYLAKDTLLNKQVALKEVDVQAGDLRRFLEEARVMDRLRHPNIVRVNNVDKIDGKVLIDMEYVRGQNLQVLLREEGPQPLPRALDICAQVLDALDYAHGMQTVHRDIKPANILIGRDNQVKLVDFGLAEILATNAYAGGAGTYAYMAPEDFAEDDRSDHQSDIWAVGVTLYEMVTGERPFAVTKVKDPFAWKRVVESESSIPLKTFLPPQTPQLDSLQIVMNRALARDKRQRYQTAGEFRDDLRRLLAGQSLVALPARPHRSSAYPGGANYPHGMTSPQRADTGDVFERAPNSSPTSTGIPQPLPPNRAPFLPAPSTSASPETVRSVGRVVADLNTTPVERSTRYPSHSNDLTPERSNGYASSNSSDSLIEIGGRISDRPMGRVARLPASRQNRAVRLEVTPGRADFGKVRKGKVASVQIMARIKGAPSKTEAIDSNGEIDGQVSNTADWLSVTPARFDNPRQKLTLTADSERVWETGEFYDTVRIQTNAGDTEVPVRLIVTPAHARFFQVAFWFVPVFTTTLLPALAILMANRSLHEQSIPGYLPCAAATSGILALMLLLVGIAADIGLGERVACGVVLMMMGLTLGVSTATIRAEAHDAAIALVAVRAVQRAIMTGGFLGGVLLLQLLHFRKWQIWATVISILGLTIGGILFKILL